MKMIKTVVLVTLVTLLSGCFVESEKPLIKQGQDIGIDVSSYALQNMSKEVNLWGLELVERKANSHHFKDMLAWSFLPEKKDSEDIRYLYSGNVKFLPLLNRPNYYLTQVAQTSSKVTTYNYYLAHKKNDRLQMSFLKLDKTEQKQATKAAGFIFTGGYSSSIKIDTLDQLVEYAHYWLELKGNSWVSNKIPESTLTQDEDRQFSFRIITQPNEIKRAQQQFATTACLISAGHPDDPEVKKIPYPNAQGVAWIGAIKDAKVSIMMCEYADEVSPSHAVQYALARAYHKEEIYQPTEKHLGSIALSERLIKEGYPYASNLLATIYLNGNGVAKDPIKARQIMEQAPRHPYLLSSLGYFHLYGFFGQKDYSQAKALFEEASKLGNLQALARLGLMYQYGLGVTKDEKKGYDMISQAASQGDPESLYNLGQSYYLGLGVDKNFTRAISSYEKSAKGNNSAAMYVLGFMYDRGQGTKKDISKALSWLKKGAEIGNTSARDEHSRIYYRNPATAVKNDIYQQWLTDGANDGDASLQYLLGQVYETGRDQTQENKEQHALIWYHKAAQQGYASAQYSKALILLKQRSNNDEAIKNLIAASDSGHQIASLKLGDIYGQGLQRDLIKAINVKPDAQKAIHYYEKMAQQGNSYGYLKAGEAYLSGSFSGKGKITPNRSKAVDYFSKAAHAGNARGQSIYASFFLYGDTVTKDGAKALAWYTKAADQGDEEAMFSIGVMYQQGNGVKQDYAQAVGWYNKASAKNYPMSWNNLGILVENGQGTKQDLPNAIKFYQLAAGKNIHQAHGNLARIWSTDIINKKADDAIKHAKAAIKLQDYYRYHEYLAAAYASKRQFQDAIAEQATAIAMAARDRKSHSLQDYRLKQYREGKKLSCYNGVGKGCF